MNYVISGGSSNKKEEVVKDTAPKKKNIKTQAIFAHVLKVSKYRKIKHTNYTDFSRES